MSSRGAKHEYYDELNMLGYGLAKFSMAFVRAMGFANKNALYESMVERGLAETVHVVKQRQDLLDPFFDNGRKGWLKNPQAYIHRKESIDSWYGDLEVSQYAEIVKMHIRMALKDEDAEVTVSPIIKSRYKQMQLTGHEAEHYFMQNYHSINYFEKGVLDDARLLGDGYDFQISSDGHYYLAEVKGIKLPSGAIRMTENEYKKANEYKSDYGLVIVSNLDDKPTMTPVFDPVKELKLTKKSVSHTQVTFHSEYLNWR